MLARWLSVLETYDFSIQHRPGRHHTNADSLSRRPSNYCKRQDCPDCHIERICNPQPSQKGVVPSTKDISISVASRVAPIRTEDSVLTNSSDMSEFALSQCDDLDTSNWFQTWSRDELFNWQQEEISFRKFIKLKDDFITKPPRHVLQDASQSLKTL